MATVTVVWGRTRCGLLHGAREARTHRCSFAFSRSSAVAQEEQSRSSDSHQGQPSVQPSPDQVHSDEAGPRSSWEVAAMGQAPEQWGAQPATGMVAARLRQGPKALFICAKVQFPSGTRRTQLFAALAHTALTAGLEHQTPRKEGWGGYN